MSSVSALHGYRDIESTCLLLGGGGEWEMFRNSSNSEEFDEDQSEEIETQGKRSHHRIRVHAIRIRKSEEHAIIQSYKHEEYELRK